MLLLLPLSLRSRSLDSVVVQPLLTALRFLKQRTDPHLRKQRGGSKAGLCKGKAGATSRTPGKQPVQVEQLC